MDPVSERSRDVEAEEEAACVWWCGGVEIGQAGALCCGGTKETIFAVVVVVMAACVWWCGGVEIGQAGALCCGGTKETMFAVVVVVETGKETGKGTLNPKP
eukprot:8658-Chlamydomonas_euryale.AAC.2